MAGSSSPPSTNKVKISQDIDPQIVFTILAFMENGQIPHPVSQSCNTPGFFSDFMRNHVRLVRMERGRITCNISVKSPLLNNYDILHGGALASLAETVATACARTLVAEDKELFLGELGMSYLSGAPTNSEVIADGCVVRSGRNVTVVVVEFRVKKTGKLAYTARATYYNMSASKL